MTLTCFCTQCNTEAHPRIIQEIDDNGVVTQYYCPNCATAIATIIIPREQFPNFLQWKAGFDQLIAGKTSVVPTTVLPPTVN